MKNYVRSPYELFSEMEKLPVEQHLAHLKDNLSFGVVTVLQGNFSPSVVLDLPEGEPPFVRDKTAPDRTLKRFDNAVKPLGYCLESNKGHNSLKKQKIFIDILEAVYEKDADILIAMKDKCLTDLYPFITLELAKAARIV
jgi:hypothetical protein